ncbi:hypothetical protein [Streptomyces spongiae]|uniref:Uncharacterized protein n=1 Tax=Streptomyces spongiae TaxID=565072 RepID=A0A5N8XDJ4_9ACTN|nr:hypothetical protein [Streptomyces spongiae]MPY57186.1 hypothetical protein [Streptomyces spongiae]
MEPQHRTLICLAAALLWARGGLRSAGITVLRGLRPTAGLSPADTVEHAAMTRSAVLEQGRARTLDPQVAELASATFGAGAEAVVLAGHAQTVTARPAHGPLLLERRLPEQLAAHFDMWPNPLRDLALRLSNAPEGGLL